MDQLSTARPALTESGQSALRRIKSPYLVAPPGIITHVVINYKSMIDSRHNPSSDDTLNRTGNKMAAVSRDTVSSVGACARRWPSCGGVRPNYVITGCFRHQRQNRDGFTTGL